MGIVLKNGSLLGKGHQTWQMNEINKLIWPNASGHRASSRRRRSTQTAKIAKTYGVIKKLPQGATNYTYATKALAQLKAAGVDIYGTKLQADQSGDGGRQVATATVDRGRPAGRPRRSRVLVATEGRRATCLC